MKCITLLSLLYFTVWNTEAQICTSILQCSGQNVCVGGTCQLCSKHGDCGNKNLICLDSKCTYCRVKGELCSDKTDCCGCAECACNSGICSIDLPCTSDSQCKSPEVCNRVVNGHKFCSERCSIQGPNQCGAKEECRDGHCIKCGILGEICTTAANCCGGRICIAGLCVEPILHGNACKEYDGPCLKNSDCCSRNCRSITPVDKRCG